jgi:hypothetical protein
MTGFVKSGRFRAAIGLIAAYAIALQTLFAALAPIPVNAQGIDHKAWSIICFGSGITAPSDSTDPDAPVPVSGKYHCVLCGLATAAAAILPETDFELAPPYGVSIVHFAPAPALAPARYAVRAGSARAPPLTV